MRITLVQKILIISLFIAVISFILLGYFVYEKSFIIFDRELGERLSSTASTIGIMINSEELSLIDDGDGKDNYVVRMLRKKLKKICSSSELKTIFILDKSYKIVVSMDDNYVRGDENPFVTLDLAELSEVLKGNKISTSLYKGNDGKFYKNGYSPIFAEDGTLKYILGVEAEATFFTSLIEIKNRFISVGFTIIIGIIFLTLFLSLKITRPLSEFHNMALKISKGDFDINLNYSKNDEVGDLTKIFKEMVDSIKNRQRLLESSLNFAEEKFSEVSGFMDILSTSIPSGIITFDHEYKLSFYNERAIKLLGLKKDEINGKTYKEIFNNKLKTIIILSMENNENILEKRVDLEIENKRLILKLSGFILKEENYIKGYTILIDDITHEIELEETSMKKKHLATIGEMSARIAHEMRNPLGTIRGFSELIKRNIEKKDRIEEYISDIQDEIENMNRIITDFLKLSRIKNNELESIRFKKMLEKLKISFSAEIEKKRIALSINCDGDLVINYDYELLSQIVNNLFRNSIEAIKENGKIIISVIQYSDEFIEFKISDNGVGIEEKNLNKIFQPFYTNKINGTGIGLALVQRNVEENGGKIEIKSEVGKGTEVKLFLKKI